MFTIDGKAAGFDLGPDGYHYLCIHHQGAHVCVRCPPHMIGDPTPELIEAAARAFKQYHDAVNQPIYANPLGFFHVPLEAQAINSRHFAAQRTPTKRKFSRNSTQPWKNKKEY